MTVKINHAKVSGKAAGTDAGRVYGNHWDQDHVVVGAAALDGGNIFTGTQSITPPAASLTPGLQVTQTPTGTTSPGFNALNSINVPSDSVNNGDGNEYTAFSVIHRTGGSTVLGMRSALHVEQWLDAPTNPSSTQKDTVGGTFQVFGGVGNSGGGFFASNSVAFLLPTASGAGNLTGHEIDIAAFSGSSTISKYGLAIVQVNPDAVQGSTADAGIVFANNGTSGGWKKGIGFGAATVSPGGVVIDMTGLAQGGPAYLLKGSQGSNFYVDGAGSIGGNNLSLTGAVVMNSGPSSVFSMGSGNTGFQNTVAVRNAGTVNAAGTAAGFAAQLTAGADAQIQVIANGGASPSGLIVAGTGLTGGMQIAANGGPLLLTSPTATNATITGSFTATGLVKNADLVNSAITINGASFALGTSNSLSGITTAMFAANVVDNDSALTANSSTRLPTQAAVKAYADALIAANDAMVFKGVIDCSANPNYPAADRGHTYKVSVAGKIGGASGVTVEIGDTLLCITDGTASGTQAAVGAQWNIVQANLVGAVTGPASSTSGNIATFNGTGGTVIQDGGKALPTGAIVGTTDSQTLTNKSLTSPAITTPTGIVKGDVGLGSVDNTSDATKNAASVTLTNKTLTSPAINGGVLDSASTINGATYPAIAAGDVLYGSAANVVSKLAKNTSATRYLSNTGASNIPAWSQVDLTSGVTNALPLANGGTNATTAQGAAASLKVPYILAQSYVQVPHTGDLVETTLATITIPANAMGPNGSVRVTYHLSFTNSANNKTMKIYFNGTGGTLYSNIASTTLASQRIQQQISNRNATNSQVGNIFQAQGGFGGNASPAVTSAVDTTAAVNIVITGQLANTGETITLEGYTAELLVP